MITANELRIGNIIQLDEDFFPCKTAVIDRVSTKWVCVVDVDDVYPIDRIEPIELSPDILQKSGFEFSVSEWVDNLAYYCKAPITFYIESDVLTRCYIGTDIIENIKHVHQLQNLYFALTGQELTINLL